MSIESLPTWSSKSLIVCFSYSTAATSAPVTVVLASTARYDERTNPTFLRSSTHPIPWCIKKRGRIRVKSVLTLVLIQQHPGGRGMAGGQHHHRTNLDKYHPGYFGKVGMRRFHLLRNHQWKPEINVDKVSILLLGPPTESCAHNGRGGRPLTSSAAVVARPHRPAREAPQGLRRHRPRD